MHYSAGLFFGEARCERVTEGARERQRERERERERERGGDGERVIPIVRMNRVVWKLTNVFLIHLCIPNR